jgi:hypothetical protein
MHLSSSYWVTLRIKIKGDKMLQFSKQYRNICKSHCSYAVAILDILTNLVV